VPVSIGKIKDGASFFLPPVPQLLPVRCHPQRAHLERLDEEWVRTFLPFPTEVARAEFLGWRSAVWTALAFPTAGLDQLVDINLIDSYLFALDDACYDVYAQIDKTSARQEFAMLLACLANEDVPAPSSPYVAALQDIWHRMRTRIPSRQQARFLAAAEIFLHGCLAEIHGRSRQEILAFDAYLTLRTQSLAGHFYLMLTEYAAEVDLEDDLRNHAELNELNRLATQHWLFANDLFSFRREYYLGDFMNAVLVLIHREDLGLQEAVDTVSDLLHRTEAQFVRKRDLTLNSTLGQRPEIRRYLDVLGLTMAGNLEQSRFAPRYHGAGYHGRPFRSGHVTLWPDRTDFSADGHWGHTDLDPTPVPT
jgi:hypothetical protein